MKKSICIISIIIVALILLIYIFKVNNYNGVSVTFHNETNQTLENLNIQFSNESSMTSVPSIAPNQETSVAINHNKDFTEGNLRLIYYDVNQEEHQEIIIGYIEKGWSAHVRVDIKSIDSNGLIHISIKD